MICPNCNSFNPDGTKFCSVCGVKLAQAEQPVQPAEPANNQAVYENAAAPNGQQDNQNGYQTNYQQPNYQQPVPPAAPVFMNGEQKKPLGTSQFVLLEFLTSLPIAGFILLLVWAFGDDVNENKRNYCRAKLIWLLIGIGITVFVLIMIISAAGSLANFLYSIS